MRQASRCMMNDDMWKMMIREKRQQIICQKQNSYVYVVNPTTESFTAMYF